MKGAIAAFTAALAATPAPAHGTISLLITGDEEGPAQDGTVRVLAWMAEHDLTPDLCLVGEPTNATQLGQTIKIGRRGSLNATLTVHGTQGHAAYPQRADNPNHRLIAALAALTAHRLDAGNDHFEPSSLQITSIDVGNPASQRHSRQRRPRASTSASMTRHTGASAGRLAARNHRPPRPALRSEPWPSAARPSSPRQDHFTRMLSDCVQAVTGHHPHPGHGRRDVGCTLLQRAIVQPLNSAW